MDQEAGAARGDELSWRRLFEKLSEGFLVGELIRDADGRPVDWTYLDLNAAWSELIGLPVGEVIGRAASAVNPSDNWIAPVAAVVETRRPRTFVRQVGVEGRRHEGHAFHLEDDKFAVVFVETTERDRADRRQAALLTLGDLIRDLDDPAQISATGSRLVGEALGVARAGFGRIDVADGTIELDAGWTAPGVRALTGLHRFADFGRLLDEMARGEALVIEDVRTDPRTAADPSALLGAGVAALVNMPVRERGQTVAALIVHAGEARRWTDEEVAFLRNVADRVEAGVARLQAEQRQAVLNGEMAHRIKNTLAMVQAIATQTLRRQTDPAALDMFERRLTALATAQDILLGRGWDAAELGEVARAVLAVVVPDDRIAIDGPPVTLGARAAVSLSLLLHELGTNAVKYGSLGVEGGTVEVDWSVDARLVVTLRWTERGGPPAAVPTRKGFGSRLIAAGLIGTGGVELHYGAQGFAATMRAPLAELQSG